MVQKKKKLYDSVRFLRPQLYLAILPLRLRTKWDIPNCTTFERQLPNLVSH